MADSKELLHYVKLYDELVPFPEYWALMFPNEPNLQNIPCKLHDEDASGQSFSYSYHYKFWHCFGRCDKSGGSVRFHYLYMKKFQADYTLYEALQSMYSLFPGRLPVPDIDNRRTKVTIKEDLTSQMDLNKLKTDKEFKVVEDKTFDATVLEIMLG